MDFSKLVTEHQNEQSENLDALSPLEAARLMNSIDKEVALAVEKALPQIAEMIEKIIFAFKNGGRLVYCGAGTSGRLGVLDASECPPTYGVEPEMVVGVIAGGDRALRFAVEGAEDLPELGEEDMKKINLSGKDVLIGISSSGYAPYCVGAIEYANSIGASTGAVVCVPDSNLSKYADITMAAVVGPEILSGSTRLKAGTATKMILNMLTTLSMVGIGKAYKNFMVDMVPTNVKLHDRAIRIVSKAAQVERSVAEKMLNECGGNMKAAIVCIKTGCDTKKALAALKKSEGFVRKAIELIKS